MQKQEMSSASIFEGDARTVKVLPCLQGSFGSTAPETMSSSDGKVTLLDPCLLPAPLPGVVAADGGF